MVAAQHNGSDFAVADHFVKFEGDFQTTHRILIEDARLRADDECVLLGVTNPVVIVSVLTAAVGVDALHGGVVGLDKILMFAAQANPAEGSVTIIEQHRAHDILDI